MNNVCVHMCIFTFACPKIQSKVILLTWSFKQSFRLKIFYLGFRRTFRLTLWWALLAKFPKEIEFSSSFSSLGPSCALPDGKLDQHYCACTWWQVTHYSNEYWTFNPRNWTCALPQSGVSDVVKCILLSHRTLVDAYRVKGWHLCLCYFRKVVKEKLHQGHLLALGPRAFHTYRKCCLAGHLMFAIIQKKWNKRCWHRRGSVTAMYTLHRLLDLYHTDKFQDVCAFSLISTLLHWLRP